MEMDDLGGMDSRESRTNQQIADLKHEVEETRKQMIKTANILGNLSAEIRVIGRQYKQERRGLTLNSAAAYVLFVVLVAAGFYFVFRSQRDRLEFEKNKLVREHASAKTELQNIHKELQERREAESEAASFYQLSQSGQLHKALHRYDRVAQLPLSRVEAAVFQDWAHRTRNRLAYSAYNAGMKAVGEKHWKRASTEFARSLEYLPHPPHEASLRYYLGISLMQLGSYKEAAAELERALGVDAEKTISREIRFHLGTIFEQLGQREKAVRAYSAYIKRHAGTNFAKVARRRIKALQ